MKAKALIPLIAVCVILGALVMMKRSGEETTTIIEQAEFASLVPENLNIDEVNRFEVYAGAKNGQRVVVQRDGEDWRIGSHFDAKAVDGRPEQLLNAVADIQGEFRATVTDEQLADYNLSDERAYHFIGFDGEERNELFHVLVGKSPKYGDMFMRTSGSNDVFVVNHNLRRDAFNYSLDWDDPPLSAPWADKTIVSLKGDDYTKIEITMPDKKLVAELREKPVVEEASSDEDATPATPPVPEKEWVVTEGGRTGTVHQTPFRDLTRYISNLASIAVVSPQKMGIWDLEEPRYFVTAHRENGEKVSLTVGRPNIGDPAYVLRTDNENPTVYSISDVNFNALFAAGGSFYDLPGLLLEENSIQEIEYQSAGEQVKLAKENGKWTVLSPVADLAPNASALDELERSLSAWQAADYADDIQGIDWAASGETITFGNDSETHTLALGEAAKHVEGRYAKLDAKSDRLVMNQGDVDKIFLPLGKIFESDLFPELEDDDEIVRVELTKASDSMTLMLEEEVWSATVGDDTQEAPITAVNSLLTAIEKIESVDVQLANARTKGAVVGSVSVTTAQGVDWTIVIEEQVNGEYPAVVNGSSSANMINQKSFNALFPNFSAFEAVEGETLATINAPAQPVSPLGNAPTGHEGHNH